MLDPTYEENDEDVTTIRWQSSPEINQMIKEAGGGKEVKIAIAEKEIEINETEEVGEREKNSEIDTKKKRNSKFLSPNNFVCTTAVKAYGRKMQVDKALSILPWMEGRKLKPDTYLLSSLLFVCAKTKRVEEAENIFWQQIPSRNLTYSVATTNSLMYMYAKLNRPDDALKVYELAKGTYVRMLYVRTY